MRLGAFRMPTYRVTPYFKVKKSLPPKEESLSPPPPPSPPLLPPSVSLYTCQTSVIYLIVNKLLSLPPVCPRGQRKFREEGEGEGRKRREEEEGQREMCSLHQLTESLPLHPDKLQKSQVD